MLNAGDASSETSKITSKFSGFATALKTSVNGAVQTVLDAFSGHEGDDFVNVGSEEDQRFDEIIGELENILLDPDFVALQSRFFDQWQAAFEIDEEENKLEYTDIFKNYTQEVEAFLDEKLTSSLPWFTMDSFMEMLTARAKAGESLEGDVFEVLHSLGDFESFKEMIVHYKKVR